MSHTSYFAIIIFIERLSSWFDISSTALSWIKSYLLNRSIYVNIENFKSSVFQLLYGVHQGSVLDPLLFILYTTPLSTVISNSSANHQLYADDTQLLLTFSALDFSHNITHLENTITNIANWMSITDKGVTSTSCRRNYQQPGYLQDSFIFLL